MILKRLAPLWRKAEFDGIFGESRSKTDEIIAIGVEKTLFQENPDLAEEIETKIREVLSAEANPLREYTSC